MRNRVAGVTLSALLFCAGSASAQIEPGIVERDVPTGVELELGGAYEQLSNDRDAWDEEFVRLQIMPRSGASVAAEIMQAQRFGIRDTQGRLTASSRLGRVWAASAEVAAAPDATILPTLSLLGNLYRDVGNGFQLGLGGRYSDYQSGPVTIGTGSLDYYLPDIRLGYTVSVGFVDGENAPSHAASLSRYYGAASSINAVVSNGESVERVTAETLLVTQTRSVAVWGVHWLTPRFAGTYGAAFNRQEDLFDRTRIQLGLRARIR